MKVYSDGKRNESVFIVETSQRESYTTNVPEGQVVAI